MNIEVLKAYKIVVERGSLTAAARELGLTQPAVSMQIAALEEYFGARLLHRTARGVELTVAGEHVLELADKFEKIVLEARQSVAEGKEELEGELKIASSNIPGMYILPQLANAFRQQHPKVTVTLEIQNSRQAIDRLLSGDVHIAATGDKIINDRIDITPIKQDYIILIAPQDYNATRIQHLDSLIECKVPLVRRLDGSATLQNVNKFLKEQGLDVNNLNVVSKYNSVITQINSVAAGGGLAFVSQLAAQRALALQQIKKVDIMGLPLERQLYLVVKKTGERSRVENSFWDMILNEGVKI